MNKNYYDILQINQNASPEIIEKAYKTLAKKYHPDLQEESNKKEAEEILKEINEAYEILSNPDKKALYDQNLKNQTISQEDYEQIYSQNMELKEELNNLKNDMYNNTTSNYNSSDATPKINLDSFNSKTNQNTPHNNEYINKIRKEEQELEYRKQQLEFQEQMEQARRQAYHDAYIQDLKNRGYRIKYKKSFKDYFKGIVSIVIVIVVLILLWHVPFIQNFFIDLYENNNAIHFIVDFFTDLFN